MMKALHILVLCSFSCATAIDIFLDGPAILLDCGIHPIAESAEKPGVNRAKSIATEELGETTTECHTTEEPIDPKELYEAAERGDLSFINTALSRLSTSGLDINDFLWRKPTYGRVTALHITNDPRIMAALLNAGADPDVQNNGGDTPVYWAAQSGYTSVLEQLFIHGADPNIVNGNGNSPLMRALTNGQDEAVRMLIEAGAHMNHANKWGTTALHTAARYNNANMARLLLQKGADKNMKDFLGGTPADQAREKGNQSLAQLIDNY